MRATPPPESCSNSGGGPPGPEVEGLDPRARTLRPITLRHVELRALSDGECGHENGFARPAPWSTAMPDGRMTVEAT